MDQFTLNKLEFAIVRDQVADEARSSLGKEQIAELLPTSDLAWLEEQHARTAEMVELLDAQMPPPLGGLKDIRLAVKRASLGVQLEIDQVVQVRDVADLTGRAYEYWLTLTADYPRVERLLSDMADLRPLARQIDHAIDDRGQVRSDATAELATIRAQMAEHEARIQKELGRLLRVHEIRQSLRYSQPTMSGEHHVLAVAVNHRHKVPGVVHRTSSSGETIYIEPTRVAEISAEMSLLRSAEQREVRRVLRRLTEAVSSRANDLSLSLEILTELDVLAAKALYARRYLMTVPKLTSEATLHLAQARHPILQALFDEENAQLPADAEKRQVVPITLHLGEDHTILVITGPNTGGKTVVLKTVGLVTLMALSGLHIPTAPGSVVGVFDLVLADIGDEQSLQQSLSTFSAHMTRIKEILEKCTPKTLVLLDELGAGTDPGEGASLGQAILDELRERDCLAMVTTHLGDLKAYALKNARVENAAVEFDAETLRPTYRLLVGQFGESCALKVAKRLKVPRRLLARAYDHLRRRRGRAGKEMRELQEIREQTEKARQDAFESRQRASETEAELKRKQEQIQQEADVQREIDRFRTTMQPGDTVRVLSFDKTGTVKRVDRRREIAAVLVGAVEWELPFDDLFPAPRA